MASPAGEVRGARRAGPTRSRSAASAAGAAAGAGGPARAVSRQRLAESLWWADRCGLPLTVTVGNERRDVLASLTDRVRDRVEELRIEVNTEAASVQDPALASDGQCGNFLCALLTFPHVTKLSIVCSKTDVTSRETRDVNHTLRVAAEMPISEICVRGFMELTDLSVLAGSQHLQHLTVTHCGIQSVSDLVSCPMLTELDVSHNQHLQTLSGLASAPRLKTLIATDCDIRNLDGLGSCPNLCKLDACSNECLESTRGLAGAPSLEKLFVNCCNGLRNVEGLASCPLLTELDVQFDTELEGFDGLAGAPSLRTINANGCGLRSVDGLNQCPQLSEIDISENGALEDLSGLAGAPRLERI
ncbi:hypothetical protein ABB37_04161 [Leptomonas pyrrhocoris]|uniref:Leucine-rich repeat protein (LRRP) n=1 Tax=Leptomonas pyrrhocoris TaxID=157538 RepID=A0A0N0DWQ9_LEPPY|nr:hypothetical protein ABB37_04161 [Leptomonas pyrrhocoris]KPA81922.1 hypothetical protein ABB37_04161 [Leptomonas pyrrhocoris]|eukprot:XP_015660361.1 hypothetical protein ABB37_04161 [Leptomonas pyrrhocoris]